jgi:hypothetical protein
MVLVERALFMASEPLSQYDQKRAEDVDDGKYLVARY